MKASRVVYPLVNAAHILSLATLFGAIMALDLRLLGAFRIAPVQPLAVVLPKLAAAGLAAAVMTGALLFMVQPLDYAANPAFLTKIGLVGIGTLHAGFVHATGHWQRVVDEGHLSGSIRISAALSMTIWMAAIVAGRFIAFVG
nr:DUF2214 domain-containing protein [Aurantimonas marianensis]